MAKTKLASRAAAWLRDGRILVIPEIIITDQASPPSLGRRAEWISRPAAALGAVFTKFGPGGLRGTLVEDACQDSSVFARAQKPV